MNWKKGGIFFKGGIYMCGYPVGKDGLDIQSWVDATLVTCSEDQKYQRCV